MALRSEIPESEELNLTPMIDVVFNLLIFFLLGAAYLSSERELQLRLPEVVDAAPVTEAPDEITIAVLANGSIIYDGDPVQPDELAARLVRARENDPDQAVAVRGAAEVRYEEVARVVSLCRQAGIVQLDMLVTTKGAAP